MPRTVSLWRATWDTFLWDTASIWLEDGTEINNLLCQNLGVTERPWYSQRQPLTAGLQISMGCAARFRRCLSPLNRGRSSAGISLGMPKRGRVLSRLDSHLSRPRIQISPDYAGKFGRMGWRVRGSGRYWLPATVSRCEPCVGAGAKPGPLGIIAFVSLWRRAKSARQPRDAADVDSNSPMDLRDCSLQRMLHHAPLPQRPFDVPIHTEAVGSSWQDHAKVQV
jgi:hypothetical protein